MPGRRYPLLAPALRSKKPIDVRYQASVMLICLPARVVLSLSPEASVFRSPALCPPSWVSLGAGAPVAHVPARPCPLAGPGALRGRCSGHYASWRARLLARSSNGDGFRADDVCPPCRLGAVVGSPDGRSPGGRNTRPVMAGPPPGRAGACGIGGHAAMQQGHIAHGRPPWTSHP